MSIAKNFQNISITNITNLATVGGTITSTTITSSNLLATLGTIQNLTLSNLTSANIFASLQISTGNILSTTSTIPNMFSTNITTTSLLATSQISSGSLYSTNITTNNLVSTTGSIANLFLSNITTTSLLATSQISTGNVLSSSINTNFASISTLVGNALTQNANDTLFIGGNGNFFIDRSIGNNAGGIIFNYNTPKTVGIRPGFQVYSNSTDRNLLFNVISKGASGYDLVQVNTFLEANNNSNTIGNLFTTGGNVGISTTSPAYTMSVNTISDVPALNPGAFNGLLVWYNSR